MRFGLKIKQMVKDVIMRIDSFSPYPVYYPFIMSKDEKKFFNLNIKESKNYLEFGLGGSTLRAIQKSKANIYVVESCPEWITYMRRYVVLRYYENKRLFIFPVNIGPTARFGYPKPDNPKNLFPLYSSNIFKEIDSKIKIDLALVDGRFRVACILKIILEFHKYSNFKVMVHDFWKRDEYHVVLKYLDIIDTVDTMGLFSIKKNVDLKLVEKDYHAYKFNPR